MNQPILDLKPIRRALISVSDKEGIIEFANYLVAHNIALLSTGGSCRLLRSEGIAVEEVCDYTGFPEIMDGRVKTLHPKIYAGILGRSGIDDAVMEQQHIGRIDLVVVNLYPFAKTVANPQCSFQEAIETIDIGGPAMVRAAAKNHNDVAVVVDSSDYQTIADNLEQHQGSLPRDLRFKLATKAFQHTAAYDDAIANHFGKLSPPGDKDFPSTLNIQLHKKHNLRYGENPQQKSAFYAYQDQSDSAFCLADSRQLQGKQLSYNNIADIDAAIATVQQFEQAACVIVKHANPCGAAISTDDTLLDAYQRAYQTDPTSAFGGIIAANRQLDEATAQAIVEQQFVEVIVVPSIDQNASTIIASKPKVRLLIYDDLNRGISGYHYKAVAGGFLVQTRDTQVLSIEDCRVVSKRPPTEREQEDLLFAWKIVKMVKSNAIVYAKENRTLGIGAGQMSRIDSVRLAIMKAELSGLDTRSAAMASDAFFPFRDGINRVAQAGITAVIQPGGSMRDQEVIDAVNEYNMTMLFTATRHFNH